MLKFVLALTQNLKFVSVPTPTPDASQWNIGCVGSQRKMLVLAMYISCFLCRFHLCLVPNANPISSGICAVEDVVPWIILLKKLFQNVDRK